MNTFDRSYNWASGKNEKGNHPEGINYVPMLHGKATPGVDDKPALFETNKAKFKDWGVTHILSFNEPDVSCLRFFWLSHSDVFPTISKDAHRGRGRQCYDSGRSGCASPKTLDTSRLSVQNRWTRL